MALILPKKVPEMGFYYHYKHDPQESINHYAYEILGIGFHTEDNVRENEEHFLLYRPLYSAPVFQMSQKLQIPCCDARPLEMWMENVEKNGKIIPRFQKIIDEKIITELQKIKLEMYPE